MSRLEELIAELCPNGVEYKRLADICNRQKGIAITAGEMKELDTPSGDIRIFAAGNTIANVNYEDIPAASVITIPSVIVKSRGNIGFEYYDKPFTHKNEMWSYSSKDKNINIKFVYYFLDNHINEFQVKAKTGKLPQISTPDTDNYKIPVPPLPVQEEIVRILDTFSELTAELTAELSKRKQQYQYYRNTLVDFKDGLDRPFKINKLIADLCPNGVEYKTLGELATDIFRGSGITRDQVRKSGTPCVRYGEIYTTYGVWFEECVSFTDESIIPSKKYFEYGDILFAITGEKVEDIAKSCVYIGKEKCLIGGDIVVMKHTQNPKYMGYALSTSSAQAQKSKGKVKSKVVHSSIPSIKEIVIPVPPLPIQKEIVAILDRFDALCNDLTSGLPAEIEARKKQYEYYRDKLLTFKEAV